VFEGGLVAVPRWQKGDTPGANLCYHPIWKGFNIQLLVSDASSSCSSRRGGAGVSVIAVVAATHALLIRKPRHGHRSICSSSATRKTSQSFRRGCIAPGVEYEYEWRRRNTLSKLGGDIEQLKDSSRGRLPCQRDRLLPGSSAGFSGDPGVVGI
jgi:hypothetical protein